MADLIPFRVDDGLTPEQARDIVRRQNAAHQTKRSTTVRHIYYVGATGIWLAYEASTTYSGRFKISFYNACPCGS